MVPIVVIYIIYIYKSISSLKCQKVVTHFCVFYISNNIYSIIQIKKSNCLKQSKLFQNMI